MASGWRVRSLLVTGAMMLAGLSACNGGGGGGGVYLPAWYNVYGQYCGSGTPTAGCNFYADGSKITDVEDPYYSASNQLYYGTWDYTDSYGYSSEYVGWAWLSQDGILYDQYGNALNEEGDQDSRDLIGNVAASEQKVVATVGKAFAAKYALSEDKGISIAKTLNEWATLSKREKRARTDADVADFSKRLYGVSMDRAQAALNAAKTGDLSAVNSVNADVASFWGTSAETSKAILKSWYKDQLSQFGL